jgi:polysaccharide export outer membrane protein
VKDITSLVYFICSVVLLSFPYAQAADFFPGDKNNLADLQKMGKISGSLNSSRPLLENADNSVDPNFYCVGGGDEFFISVIGNPAVHYYVAINQDGELYIPELGLKKLGKITLADAQKQIRSFIQEKLKKPNEIYVSLVRVKMVTITVNGAVSDVGTYTLPGSYRVLDALRVANNNTVPSLNECNFREVKCNNRDSTTTIDMFTYLLKYDISGNPYLYSGDDITLAYADKRVNLNASTKSMVTGWIPIKSGETLSDFLSFFTFDASADTSIIYLQKFIENNDRSIQAVSKNDDKSIPLCDREIITIPQKKNYSLTLLVEISGEVARPGIYPISSTTKAGDIIAMAGGGTPDGNMGRAVVLRRSKNTEKSGKKDKQNQVSGPDVEVKVRPEMYAGLKKMASLEDYTIIELDKNTMATTLVSDDHIVVPRKDVFVYVSGDVKKPGAYAFAAGKPYSYYIDNAGGFTSKADRSNLFGVRNFENASQMTDLSEIHEGDIIVVPDSEQAKLLITVFLPIFQVVLTILSVGLAIFSLTK